MKILASPQPSTFTGLVDLKVSLFHPKTQPDFGSSGVGVKKDIKDKGLEVDQKAWDFVAIAHAIMACDSAGHRARSTDGWTRQFDLTVAVSDPEFWNSQRQPLQEALSFLTTDQWQLDFIEGGDEPPVPREISQPSQRSVVLLSGGLDSLIGAIDLKVNEKDPFAVGQLPKDGSKQTLFAQTIAIPHLLLNHNTVVPNAEKPPSSRGRSIIFIAFGIAVATSLASYKEGDEVCLYVCENGLISINPPLTPLRLGSLSTRTTHPYYLGKLQEVFYNAGIHVRIFNPYQYKTKGEMLNQCVNQELLANLAHQSTSCGRYKRNNFKHCGRCVPCQIRRAAFLAWEDHSDNTPPYINSNLNQQDKQHAWYDDVRSVAMALAEIRTEGFDYWLGATVNSSLLTDHELIKGVARRGMEELARFHQSQGI